MNAKELIGLKQKYEDAVEKHGKSVLAELFKEFFDEAPDVEKVKWTQYTPHFNDGDSCTFGVNEFEYVTNGDEKKKTEDEDCEDDDGTEGTSSYGLTGKLKKAAEELEKQCSALEDLFLGAFHDHTEVTAARNGKFKTREFEHD